MGSGASIQIVERCHRSTGSGAFVDGSGALMVVSELSQIISEFEHGSEALEQESCSGSVEDACEDSVW